jgi:hypothetical protein
MGQKVTQEFNIVPQKRPMGVTMVNLSSKSLAMLERFPKALADAVAAATEEVLTPPETVAAAPVILVIIELRSRTNQK